MIGAGEPRIGSCHNSAPAKPIIASRLKALPLRGPRLSGRIILKKQFGCSVGPGQPESVPRLDPVAGGLTTGPGISHASFSRNSSGVANTAVRKAAVFYFVPCSPAAARPRCVALA
jgi:hypothetical protein